MTATTASKAPASNRCVGVVLALLLAVVCVPAVAIHGYRMSLPNHASGTLLVVFPPQLKASSVYQRVLAADGRLLQPVSWLGNAWVVYSETPAFVSRLKAAGAWRGFSVELLNPAQLLSCTAGGQPGGE